MEKVKQKVTVMNDALQTLTKSIKLFHEYEKIYMVTPSSTNEDLYTGLRDSMIQRFEYCVDLFWKTLKIYLEEKEKLTMLINSPRGIIRQTINAKIISEQEGEQCMSMIESRNRTSHMYHREIAEEIAHEVPSFYKLIQIILDRISGVTP